MNHLDSWEIKARECVNQLKKEFVINSLTADRLHDIYVYLLLAQASRNQRGVDMQQAALQSVLRNCQVINKLPVSNHPVLVRARAA